MSETYREALVAIAEYQPEWEPWVHPDPDCSECAHAKARKWPPSGLCHGHFSMNANHQSRMQRRQNSQWIEMKRIAYEALAAQEDTDA